MDTKKQTGKDGLTLEQLEKKYGSIKVLTIGREVEMIPDPDNEAREIESVTNPGKEVWLRKPDRATIKYALSKQIKADQSIDTISPGEVILNKCWVGGDEDVKTDNKYFFRACIEAGQYLNEEVGFF